MFQYLKDLTIVGLLGFLVMMLVSYASFSMTDPIGISSKTPEHIRFGDLSFFDQLQRARGMAEFLTFCVIVVAAATFSMRFWRKPPSRVYGGVVGRR